jgi:hypothetical protein
MDNVPSFNVFKQIALGVREEEKGTAGTVALDEIAPWQATTDL